ncbi:MULTISPECIES: hypothetical protein [unclassified Nonomuraea]|uniref:hypothetical protein n=1 Tax=unclassified Nonomuraea TaxID=2593643 RepID=UPI0033F87503
MEDVRGLCEVVAGVGGAFGASQVGAVGELDAGQVEGPAVIAGFLDRCFEGGGVGVDTAMADVEQTILGPLDQAERATLRTLLQKITAELPYP